MRCSSFRHVHHQPHPSACQPILPAEAPEGPRFAACAMTIPSWVLASLTCALQHYNRSCTVAAGPTRCVALSLPILLSFCGLLPVKALTATLPVLRYPVQHYVPGQQVPLLQRAAWA